MFLPVGSGSGMLPGGGSFVSLAKNKEWDDDIYENLVAKHFHILEALEPSVAQARTVETVVAQPLKPVVTAAPEARSIP